MQAADNGEGTTAGKAAAAVLAIGTAIGAPPIEIHGTSQSPADVKAVCEGSSHDDTSTSFKARTILEPCSWQEGSLLGGQYCIQEQLGEGGSGTVFRCVRSTPLAVRSTIAGNMSFHGTYGNV